MKTRSSRKGAARIALLILGGVALAGTGAAVFYAMSPRDLRIDTDPPGASVFINGRLMGKTPLVFTDLQSGNYGLRIEKENYETLSRPLAVPSETRNVVEKLKPNGLAGLTVDIDPDRAEVLLDGEVIGHTPLKVTNIPAGTYDLLIRKSNFKSYSQRVTLEAGQMLEFRDFMLTDKVLAMLESNIEGDPQRVSNYMDLGHYLFVNNRISRAGDLYIKAIEIGATELKFPNEMKGEDRLNEQRLRAEDVNRMHEEFKHKYAWPGKDTAVFKARVEEALKKYSEEKVAEWNYVEPTVQAWMNEGKHLEASQLLLRHIKAVEGKMKPKLNGNLRGAKTQELAQAYIMLITTMLRQRNFEGAETAYKNFIDRFGQQAVLLRQAANAIYGNAGAFEGEQRIIVLSWAEKMLRDGIVLTKYDRPLLALIKFELGNVLRLQMRYAEAIAIIKESIEITDDATTKRMRQARIDDIAAEQRAKDIERRSKLQEAEVLLRRTLEAGKLDAETRCNTLAELSANLREQRRFKDSIEILTEAINGTQSPESLKKWQDLRRDIINEQREAENPKNFK